MGLYRRRSLFRTAVCDFAVAVHSHSALKGRRVRAIRFCENSTPVFLPLVLVVVGHVKFAKSPQKRLGTHRRNKCFQPLRQRNYQTQRHRRNPGETQHEQVRTPLFLRDAETCDGKQSLRYETRSPPGRSQKLFACTKENAQ